MAEFLDLINFAAFRNIPRALGLQILDVREGKTPSGVSELPVFRVGPVEIHRAWCPQLYGGDDPPGRWRDKNGGSGEDFVSLITHMSSSTFLKRAIEAGDTPLMREANALFDADASEERSANVLMQRLGIKPDTPAIEQKSGRRGWQQVPYASRSSPSLMNSRPGGISPWPYCNITRLPFLGLPQQLYEFRDADGRIQMYVGEWLIDGLPSFWFAFTLWHRIEDPLEQKWLPLRSSLPTSPFGLEVVLANPDAAVVILDSLADTRLFNEQRDASEQVVSAAWARALIGSSPSDTDWSKLKGQKILIVVGEDKKSMAHAVELVSIFGTGDGGNLSVRFRPSGPLLSSSLFAEAIGGDLFLELAEHKYGLIRPAAEPRMTNVWRPDMPISDGIAEAQVKPFVYKKGVTMLCGPGGAGKTSLVALIGCSAASGKTLLEPISVKRPYKVLFLRSEQSDGLQVRIRQIISRYGLEYALDRIVVYPEKIEKPPGGIAKRLNLENKESWDEVQHLVDWADIVFVDHLTTFTAALGERNWTKFIGHVKSRAAQDKSFIIVHHTNKEGQFFGTGKQKIDLDLLIEMERWGNNGARIKFDKGRDHTGLGKDFVPFGLCWKFDERSGLPIWWIKEVPEEERGETHSPPPTVGQAPTNLDEDYLAANFSPQEEKVMRLLAMAHLRGTTLARITIEMELGTGSSTARTVLRTLKDAGKIEIEGQSKATRYRLADAEVSSIIR